jgi:hypothetical protein
MVAEAYSETVSVVDVAGMGARVASRCRHTE